MRYGVLMAFLLSGCLVNPQKKGTITIQDRGAVQLTEHGDQLLDTGVYAKKGVTKDFAEGYEKGLGDSAKDAYWRMQYRQWILHLIIQPQHEKK